MPHTTTPRRKSTLAASLIPLAALLVAAALGLAACGGSSSTTTTTTTNAAATNAPTAPTTSPRAPTSTGSSSTGSAGSSTGSAGTSTSSTAPGRPNTARLSAVRACLAKKGIALPLRTLDTLGGAGGPQLPKGMSRTQFQEALRSCGGGFTGGRLGSGRLGAGRTAFTSPRFHEALVHFATCLRQNGMNVGEPNTSGKGPIFDTKGVNTGSPKFRAAAVKCRSVLFTGLRHPRASPGAAGGTATTG
jgi:hypothetical protein